ncbi:MAG: hypothetical protein ACJAS1_000512 [Oleiphilaceae bacterium]|jgi:hypothetical protein
MSNDIKKTRKAGAALLGSTNKKKDVEGLKPPRAASMFPSIKTISNNKREKTRRYKLPVSGETIDVSLISLDPRKTRVSPLNPRIQELLNKDDPKLKEMKLSMLQSGQFDPVWARPIIVGEEVWHEIFVGTTRRFISSWITEDMQDRFKEQDEDFGEMFFPLEAWVAKVPDVDCLKMSRLENQERRDLSFWEKCMDAKKNSLDPAISMLPFGDQAKIIGMSSGAYSDALSVANNMPEKLIKSLISPSLMRYRSAKRIISMLADSKDKEDYVNCVLNIIGNHKAESIELIEKAITTVTALPYSLLDSIPDTSIFKDQSVSFITKAIEDGVHLDSIISAINKKTEISLGELKDIISNLSKNIPKEKPRLIKNEGKLKAKLFRHPQTDGRYKVDLYDMVSSDIDRLQQFIEREFID